MRTFHLIIVTSDATIYAGDAVFCSATTPEGSLGIEAGHEPFLAVLKAGSKVTWRVPGGTEQSHTGVNGLLTFKENTCTIALV